MINLINSRPLILLFTVNSIPVKAQTKYEKLEFLSGLIAESLIFVPAFGRNMLSTEHLFYGTAAAFAGVIITGKYILKKDGSIYTAAIGALVGGISNYIIRGYIVAQAFSGNVPLTFVGLAWLFIMPPLGATVGYNSTEDNSSVLLNFQNRKLSLDVPTFYFGIGGDSKTVYKVDLLKISL